MVVEAGVVVVHPADKPDGEVVVAQQLLVDARARIVGDEVTPQLATAGEPRDERSSSGPSRSRPAARSIMPPPAHARPRRAAGRAGLAVRSAAVAALPSRLGDGVDDRAVRAVDERVDAGHADDGVQRARPVGRGVVEGAEGRAPPTPGRRARRGAPHAEARRRPARRRRRAAAGAPRVPSRRRPARPRAAARGSRRAPATRPPSTRCAPASSRPGPGCTSSGAPRRSSASSSGPRRAATQGRRVRRRAARGRSRRASSSASTSSGQRAVQRDGAPQSRSDL